MGTKLLTIKTDKQSVYSKVVSNWLNAGGTILQCGYARDYDDNVWWAIATIDASAKEKTCDIVRTIIRKDSVPESCWRWGDEEEHTVYYDFVMFEENQNA